MADDAMWATINADPSYFRDMPPCTGAVEFFREIEHLDPTVLTACLRTNYANTARQKREWVREHLSTKIIVLRVMGGRNKPLFVHESGDILIDDVERNTSESKAGGISILHRPFDGTRALPRTALRFTERRQFVGRTFGKPSLAKPVERRSPSGSYR